jgi:class 3 adenylate cyclase
MRTKSSTISAATRCLYESFNLDMMVRLARRIFPDYDIYRRTGYPANIPIPAQDAAKQILMDVVASDRFMDLVENLIALDRDGFMGKSYPVTYLRDLVRAVLQEGFVYDAHTGLFMEDVSVRRTPTWGRLSPDLEYPMAFLRIDIVGNSEIVRGNSQAAVRQAYADFNAIVQACSDRRKGRVWSWEGDGGLVAFFFGHRGADAVLAGMSILHELFLYNLTSNPLDTEIKVRIAAHAGPAHYSPDLGELKKNETVKDILEMESRYTPQGSLSVSSVIVPTLDRVLQETLHYQRTAGPWRMMTYSVSMEE